MESLVRLMPTNTRDAYAVSHLERGFLCLCQHQNLPRPIPQYRFDPVRKWRFDFAWPDVRLAVEIDGGLFSRGRHQRAAGYQADCEKFNAAMLAGWRVLRYTTRDLTRRPVPVAEEVAQALETFARRAD
jgi:very-short-patch-repair endonuclease